MKRNNKNVMTKEYQKGNQKFLAMHIAYQIEKTKVKWLQVQKFSLPIREIWQLQFTMSKRTCSKHQKEDFLICKGYEDARNNAIEKRLTESKKLVYHNLSGIKTMKQ